MYKYIICLVLLLFTSNTKAQFDNNWCFGWHAGINFNTNPPTIFESQVCMDSNNKKQVAFYTSSSMSDCHGNLLFYSSGSQIWNRNHQIMPHGYLYEPFSSSSYTIGLIIPVPQNDSLYYIIHGEPDGGNYMYKYYIVDMRLDSGRGDIDTARGGTKFFTKKAQNMLYVKHANDTDFWLICSPDSETYAFKVSKDSISSKYIKTPSSTYYASNNYDAKTSHDGKCIILGSRPRKNYSTSMGLFDNYSGRVISQKGIFPQVSNFNYSFIEFSPNDSIIYYILLQYFDTSWGNFNIRKLYQIKRFVTDPSSSINLIDSCYNCNYFGSMQVTPDNRIFFGCPGDTIISIINNPDVWGKGCNLQKRVLNITPGMWGANPPNNYCPIRRMRFNIIQDSNNCLQDSVYFQNISDTIFKQFIWYWGDGDSTIQYISNVNAPKHLVHHYKKQGSYNVKIKGVFGKCSSIQHYSDSVHIKFKPNISLITDTAYYTCGKYHIQHTLYYKYTDTLRLHLGNLDTLFAVSNSDSVQQLSFVQQFDTSGKYIFAALALNTSCTDSIARIQPVNIYPTVAPLVELSGGNNNNLVGCGATSFTFKDSTLINSIVSRRWWNIYLPNNSMMTFDTSALFTYTFADTGDYNLSCINYTIQGCIDSISITKAFRINPQPEVLIIPPTRTTLCFGDSVELVASQKNSGYPPLIQYKWNTGDTTSSIIADSSKTYMVSAWNKYNCGASSSPVSIQILTQLFANVVKSGDTIKVISNRKIVNYNWYQNNSLYTNNVYLLSPPSGSYSVIIQDSNGCEASGGPLVYNGIASVDENTNEWLKVYPNPVREILYVVYEKSKPISGQVTDITPSGNVHTSTNAQWDNYASRSVSLYNIHGKIVYSARLQNGINEIPVRELSKGLYILQCGEFSVKVFVE